MSWYCLRIGNGKYYVLAKPGGEEMAKYETFNDILNMALEISLEENK
ncbi:hypothetical protein FACS1894151_11140 [Spirochaetia bacterium]|nr:hypothetical protein FACS1894151_11140 [Spirochaetia bacterium]